MPLHGRSSLLTPIRVLILSQGLFSLTYSELNDLPRATLLTLVLGVGASPCGSSREAECNCEKSHDPGSQGETGKPLVALAEGITME